MGKAYRVKMITLKNGTTLNDKIVFVNGAFLIVFNDEADDAPCWYNCDTVEKMECVELIDNRRMRVG